MNDPATILKADHREVKRLLTALADSEEGPERTAMVQDVTAALTLHMQIEEELVYPPVAREIGAEDAEEAEIEHGLARDGLEKINELVDKPGFGAAVEMLKAGIQHHVEEEEHELLPELKSSMERAEWLKLGDAVAEAKSAGGDSVKPRTTSRKSSKRRSTAK